MKLTHALPVTLTRTRTFLVFCLALSACGPSWALQQLNIDVGGVEFELVTIPPGTFSMGSNSGDGDERPVHKVTIDYSFDIGKTEVTVRQFRTFVETTNYKTDSERRGGSMHCPCPDRSGHARNQNWKNPGFEQTENNPVVCVSQNDAKAFCKWLSTQTGRSFRLPTEAEWEYACRAGTTGDYAGEIKQMAWYDMNSNSKTNPVAQKEPNPWGLFDMHGNVWEWCEDVYHWNYKNAPTDGSANITPDIPGNTAILRAGRVLRGGSWCRPEKSCRSSFRYPEHPAFAECGTGFRIVRCNKPSVATTPTAGKTRKSSVQKDSRPPEITLTVSDTDFNFIRINPGKFTMGSPFQYIDSYNWTYEIPAHEVTINYSYYMAATEVTLEQFNFFVEDTGYVTDGEKQSWAHYADKKFWHYRFLSDWRFPGFIQTDSEPVTHISLYDAVAFCEWLSEKTNRCIRLPSEAEWEYACRAGTTGDYAGNLSEMAWCRWCPDTPMLPHPVAQKKPNSWGLYDMHGNVWEWVLDTWHDDCNGAPTDGSAWLDSNAPEPMGIVRGGSFVNPPWLLRSYIRMRIPLSCMVHHNNGFRLLMSLD